MTGQVTMLVAAYSSVAAQVRAGKLRALAVTSRQRMALAPAIPTVSESGLPDFESIQWWAVSGPAGLPAAIVDRLNSALNATLKSEDVKKRFAAEGAEPGGGTPAELAAFVKRDFDKWGAVIKAVGIKAQ